MKRISPLYTLVIFIMFLMFSTSFSSFGQSSFARNEVIATAKADADRDTNKFVWVGSGCLVSGIATFLPKGYWLLPLSVVPRFYQPGPPPARLVGKSPEYVATYVAAYKSERGRSQANLAGMGCLTGTLTLWLIIKGGIM